MQTSVNAIVDITKSHLFVTIHVYLLFFFWENATNGRNIYDTNGHILIAFFFTESVNITEELADSIMPTHRQWHCRSMPTETEGCRPTLPPPLIISGTYLIFI